MNDVKNTLDSIKNTAAKSFEMIKELNYMDGIENIRSSHSVYFETPVDKRIERFEKHIFELRYINFKLLEWELDIRDRGLMRDLSRKVSNSSFK